MITQVSYGELKPQQLAQLISRRAFGMLSALWAMPKKRPRRGGWRQQMEAEELDEDPGDRGLSRLAAGHLLDWADGASSASKVQYHMANALADGLDHPMVRRLAGIGEGRNASTGLFKLLGDLGVKSLLTEVELARGVVYTFHWEFYGSTCALLDAGM